MDVEKLIRSRRPGSFRFDCGSQVCGNSEATAWELAGFSIAPTQVEGVSSVAHQPTRCHHDNELSGNSLSELRVIEGERERGRPKRTWLDLDRPTRRGLAIRRTNELVEARCRGVGPDP